MPSGISTRRTFCGKSKLLARMTPKKKVTNALAIIPPNNVEPSAASDAAAIACVVKKLGMNVKRNYEGKSSIKGWVGVGKGELRSEILLK